MSWYRTGTVTVTNGSDTVTGSGTAWSGTVDPGWVFLGPDGITYEVESVSSDTAITLATNYGGSSLSGASYALYPTQGLTRALTTSVAELISSYTGLTDSITTDDAGALVVGDTDYEGMWPDVTAATRIHRAWGRMFIGDAADATGNRTGTQGGKVPTGTEGANWAIRDGQFVSFAQQGNMAVVGFSRSEDVDPTENTSSIGVSGFAIGNNATKAVWGLYGDVQFEAGTYGYGLELAVKNKEGVNRTTTPYFATTGTYGIWLPAGGDATYGGAPTHPSNTAILIGSNSSTWNRGIVFLEDGLTRSSGFATAIHFAEKHRLVWATNGNHEGFAIRSDVDAAASDVSITASNNAIKMAGVGGATILRFDHEASAVNYATFSSAATGNYPTWEAVGTDTNVGFFHIAQGTAPHRFCSQGTISNEDFRIGGINSAPVNFLHAYGTNAAVGYAVLAAAGADSHIDIALTPKGANGRVRLGPYASSSDVAITGTMEVRDTSGVLRLVAVVG